MQLWTVDDNDLLAVKGRFQRDEQGHEVWILAAKRGWLWREGQWVETAEVELYDDPVYIAEPGSSALVYDHDFVIDKQNTDVIVHGKARTYGARALNYHECRLLVDGHIDKVLAVHGPREWITHGGGITLSAAHTFTEQNIDYSLAIGGDERNRLGGGIATSTKALLAQPVPGIFYPTEDWGIKVKHLRVAGFGPLPPFFSDRYRYAGTFDEQWQQNRRPILPEDFDRRFYQCAPFDQQCQGYLQGGERIMLSGFNHDDTLSFRMPHQHFKAQAVFGEEIVTKAMPVYTVAIDTEAQALYVTYSASFPCQGFEETLISSGVSAATEEGTE